MGLFSCFTEKGYGFLLDLIEERLDIVDALEALKELEEQGPVSWETLKGDLGI